MSDRTQSKEQQISIDIGGGRGELFQNLAKENPQKTFVVLDPSVKKEDRELPLNLHLIKWRKDKDSFLPLAKNSIDEAFLNFLHGEIDVSYGVRRRQWSGLQRLRMPERIAEEEGRYLEELKNFDTTVYQDLLRDLRRVLKKGALVHIADVRENIMKIREALESIVDFQIIGEPKPGSRYVTEWVGAFYDGAEDEKDYKGLDRIEAAGMYPWSLEAKWGKEEASD